MGGNALRKSAEASAGLRGHAQPSGRPGANMPTEHVLSILESLSEADLNRLEAVLQQGGDEVGFLRHPPRVIAVV